MTTGAVYADIHRKRLLGTDDFRNRIVDYVRTLVQDAQASAYNTGVVHTEQVTFAGSAVQRFDLDTPTQKCSDGIGNILDLTASSYLTDVMCENESGIDYHIGLHYAGLPDGIQVNPRTGLPEFIGVKEEIGLEATPDSVTNNGSTLTFNVNTLLEPGNDHSGRTVAVWKLEPGPTATTIDIALQLLTVTYGAGDNTITTADLMGQTAASTTAADYRVCLLGPVVSKDDEVRVQASGYVYLGFITGTGTGATPSSFDYTGQAVAFATLSDLPQVLTRDPTSDRLKIQVKADGTDETNPQIEVLDSAGSPVFSVDGLGNVVIQGTTEKYDVVTVYSSETITDSLTAGDDESSDFHEIKGTWTHKDNGGAELFQIDGETGHVGILQAFDGSYALAVNGDVATQNLYPEATGSYDLGSPSLEWANFYTQTLTLSGNFVPNTPDTQDIGATANRWATVYANTFNGKYLKIEDTAAFVALLGVNTATTGASHPVLYLRAESTGSTWATGFGVGVNFRLGHTGVEINGASIRTESISGSVNNETRLVFSNNDGSGLVDYLTITQDGHLFPATFGNQLLGSSTLAWSSVVSETFYAPSNAASNNLDDAWNVTREFNDGSLARLHNAILNRTNATSANTYNAVLNTNYTGTGSYTGEMVGYRSVVSNAGSTSSVSDMRAYVAIADTDSGNTTLNYRGFRSLANTGTGQVNYFYGFCQDDIAANVANAYGVYIGDITGSTTGYGLYIANGNTAAIYVAQGTTVLADTQPVSGSTYNLGALGTRWLAGYANEWNVDTNFWLKLVSSNPQVSWDASGYYLQFDRSTKNLEFYNNTSLVFSVDASGGLWDGDSRPSTDDSYSSGYDAERWSTVYTNTLEVGRAGETSTSSRVVDVDALDIGSTARFYLTADENSGSLRTIVDFFLVDNRSSGTYGAVEGVYAKYTKNDAATVTDGSLYKARATISDGTLTNYYGFDSSVTVDGTGVLTNCYHFYASNAGIANQYGFYVESLTGANSIGIYVAGATDRAIQVASGISEFNGIIPAADNAHSLGGTDAWSRVYTHAVQLKNQSSFAFTNQGDLSLVNERPYIDTGDGTPKALRHTKSFLTTTRSGTVTSATHVDIDFEIPADEMTAQTCVHGIIYGNYTGDTGTTRRIGVSYDADSTSPGSVIAEVDPGISTVVPFRIEVWGVRSGGNWIFSATIMVNGLIAIKDAVSYAAGTGTQVQQLYFYISLATGSSDYEIDSAIWEIL
jgi:hypothetical protein